MKLLLLHPMPGLGRQKAYLRTCERLAEDENIEPVFVYTGDAVDLGDAGVPVYNFDQWLAENRAQVEATDIAALERRYLRSNLWLGVVSERIISNYSLLNGSYRTHTYSRDELAFLIKAIVLFFQEIFDREQIDVVMAQHPDNIFAMLAFEMCDSLPQVPFLIFPDYYWQHGQYLLFDSKYFTSRRMIARYKALMADYEGLVMPRAAEVRSYLEPRVARDPSTFRKDLLPKMTFRKNLANALSTLRERFGWISVTRPPVERFHQKFWLPVIIRAFVMRNWNLLRYRTTRCFSRTLPEGGFVYLPLQRVPEAAMLTRSVGYLNQQSFVQCVSAALPFGYTLVVKDHPKSRSFQPVSYYKQIASLPNVVVLEDTVPNDQIMERMDLVITIAGTLGFQQLMRGESVLMFGRKFYEILEGVIRVPDLNELPYRLKEILVEGKRPSPELCRRSMQAYALAVIDCLYQVEGTNKELHQSPERLSALICEMVDTELRDRVAERRAEDLQHV